MEVEYSSAQGLTNQDRRKESGEKSERRKVGVNHVPSGDRIWKRMESVHCF